MTQSPNVLSSSLAFIFIFLRHSDIKYGGICYCKQALVEFNIAFPIFHVLTSTKLERGEFSKLQDYISGKKRPLAFEWFLCLSFWDSMFPSPISGCLLINIYFADIQGEFQFSRVLITVKSFVSFSSSG